MLTILAVSFIVFITAAIGERVARDVQDEVRPSKKYLILAADILLLLAIALTLHGLGYDWLALLVPLALIALRAKWSFSAVTIPLFGIAIGVSTLLAADIAITVALFSLMGAFLLGALEKGTRAVLARAAWQPALAILTALVLVLR